MRSESSAAESLKSLSYKPGECIPGNPHERIVKRLGTGGCATVYLTWCDALEEYHAVKFLTHGNEEARTLFFAEMKVGAKLKDENIARILSPGETADELRAPYFVMEYLDGLDLRTLIHINKKNKRTFDANWIINLAIGIFDGLTAAHALRIIHRDLKPENVFLIKLPTGGWVPKLLDWGAYGISGHREVRGEELVYRGTPTYSAPEQFTGNAVYDQTDLYSVGVILYECFAGRTPFYRCKRDSFDELAHAHCHEIPDPLSASVPDDVQVPPELGAIVESLLAKRVEDRGGVIRAENDSRPVTAEWLAKRLRELSAAYNDQSVATQMRTFENVELPRGRNDAPSLASTTSLAPGERFQDVGVKTDVDTPEWLLREWRGEADPNEHGPEPEPFVPVTPQEVELATYLGALPAKVRGGVSEERGVSSEGAALRLKSADRAPSDDVRSASKEREPTDVRELRGAITRTASARPLGAEAEAPDPFPEPRRRVTQAIDLGALPPAPKPLTPPAPGGSADTASEAPAEASAHAEATREEAANDLPRSAACEEGQLVALDAPMSAEPSVTPAREDLQASRRPRAAWFTPRRTGSVLMGAGLVIVASALVWQTRHLPLDRRPTSNDREATAEIREPAPSPPAIASSAIVTEALDPAPPIPTLDAATALPVAAEPEVVAHAPSPAAGSASVTSGLVTGVARPIPPRAPAPPKQAHSSKLDVPAEWLER